MNDENEKEVSYSQANNKIKAYRVKIQTKLFLIILCCCSVLILCMYVMTQWTLDKGLIKYVNTRAQADLQLTADSIAQEYRDSGNWDFLTPRLHRDNRKKSLTRTETQHADDSGRRERMRPPPHVKPEKWRRPPEHLRHLDTGSMPPPPRIDNRRPPPWGQKLTIIDAQKTAVMGRYNDQDRQNKNLLLIPIQTADELYGWVVHKPPGHLRDDFDLALVSALKQSFLSIAFLVLLLSAALALPLSYLLLRRIKLLSQGAQKVTAGDYSARVKSGTKDELGELSDNFNRLSQTLEANEKERQRWVADISHELRTPLAIAGGELEAMIDGVRPADVTNLHSAHAEIKHLNRLVDDFYQLSNADIGALNYHFEVIDLTQTVQDETRGLDALIQKAGLSIEYDMPDKPCLVRGDIDRLKQLLNNVISNASKYTQAPGKITLALRQQKKTAILVINDTAPGVSDTDLPRLFDPLYRTEQSRNRRTGGSGLGLGICQRIALGHQGNITANHSSLGGLQITIHLPCI